MFKLIIILLATFTNYNMGSEQSQPIGYEYGKFKISFNVMKIHKNEKHLSWRDFEYTFEGKASFANTMVDMNIPNSNIIKFEISKFQIEFEFKHGDKKYNVAEQIQLVPEENIIINGNSDEPYKTHKKGDSIVTITSETGETFTKTAPFNLTDDPNDLPSWFLEACA